jgi:hypothetical protein
MNTSRTFDITKIVEDKISGHNNNLEFSKRNIVTLDDAREPYKYAIRNIDKNLMLDIDAVNATLAGVATAYQARIDAGCRTELFWTLTGIITNTESPDEYEYTCQKISFVGYGTDMGKLPQVGSGETSITIPDKYGFEEDNLHGLKRYKQPFSEDLLDTYIGSGIGTIGVGSTELFILAPLNRNAIVGLETGMIVQADTSLVFSSNVNTIVGIGTTIKDLSELPNLGITTTQSTVNVLTLENQALRTVLAPAPDATYTTFTVLMNPDDLDDDFSVAPQTSPYVPERVGIMNMETVGSATSIIYDNSGRPNVDTQWNPFSLGLPDPENDFEEGEEPNVGAGKTYYKVGFSSAPAIFAGSSFVRFATEGESVIAQTPFGQLSSSVGNEPLSACPDEEAALTAAINVRDAKESEFNSGISTFNNKIRLVNALREDLQQIDLRIWAHRTQIGESKKEIGSLEEFADLINQPQNTSWIDSENELLDGA